ncbi:MAG TPA: class I SAM-dependent methyltransferase [Acidimicrobiales bacterium]
MSGDEKGEVGPHRRFFDLWSRVYDLPVIQWAIYRPVQEAVLRELRRPPARRILDVGCGTGILTERLARELDPELVCGCDFSIGMLEQAVTRRPGPWVQADAQHLPLSRGSVDVVVSTESFHWFPDPDAALAEFRRVLAPGGRLLVGVVNMRTATMSRAASAIAARLGEPAHWTTRAEMRRRVERAGFRVLRQHRVARIGGVTLPTVLTVAARTTTATAAPEVS